MKKNPKYHTSGNSQYKERKEGCEKQRIDALKNLFLHLGEIFISLSLKKKKEKKMVSDIFRLLDWF